MKTILISISNSLMAVSIAQSLKRVGRFRVHSISPDSSVIAEKCVALGADILLMEASYDAHASLEDRLEEAQILRSAMPACKVILLCDENSVPEIARNTAMAKRDGVIDDFVYSSVSESYLTAMLDAM